MEKNQDLTELHSALLELFKEFDRVCRNNNICYSIGFGTMLGAIRHGGFIPWDDDGDIIITRKEYEKLVTLPTREFGERFFLQTRYTDKDYPYNTTRLRMNNTAMIFDKWKESGFHQGIYIDIIPLDNIPDSKIKSFVQKVGIILLSPFRIMMNKNVFFKGGKNIPMFIKHILYGLLRRFPLESICEKEAKIAKKYSEKDCKKIGFLGEGNLFLKRWYPAKSIPSLYMSEYQDVKFEDTSLMCSKYFKELLTQWYGNYMELPPEEKRVIYHQPIFFSRTVSYSDYLKG